MKAAKTADLGPSKAIREYMDRKITSDDYFRRVRKEAVREVERELREPIPPATNGSKD